MRRMIGLFAVLVFSSSVALAQSSSSYPVTIGVAGGVMASDVTHLMGLVGITPEGWPVGLRLDGIWREPKGRVNTDLLSAVSASAVITLRPWKVAPYLIVGATRTADYAYPASGPFQAAYFPARTQLSGGLGFTAKTGRARLFLEMREMQNAGTPITFGLSF